MSLRGYGTLTTAVLGMFFGFDCLWNMTQMEAIGAGFLALLIGIFAAIIFVFVTEPRETKKPEQPQSVWASDGGLSVLIQKRRAS